MTWGPHYWRPLPLRREDGLPWFCIICGVALTVDEVYGRGEYCAECDRVLSEYQPPEDNAKEGA